MSTIWTPSGEHRIPKEPGDGQPEPAPRPAAGRQTTAPSDGRGPGERDQAPAQSLVSDGVPDDDWEPTPEEARQAKEELDAMRQQLVQAPVELIVANHAMGLWELELAQYEIAAAIGATRSTGISGTGGTDRTTGAAGAAGRGQPVGDDEAGGGGDVDFGEIIADHIDSDKQQPSCAKCRPHRLCNLKVAR